MSTVRKVSITRRRALRGMAAAAVGVAAPALANALPVSDANLRVLRCRYAVRHDRIVEGYFVSPRGTDSIDTVLLLPGTAGLDSAALATAKRYASTGKLVVLPDLAATYRGTAGRDGQIADMKRLAPKLGKLARGTGRVEIIAL